MLNLFLLVHFISSQPAVSADLLGGVSQKTIQQEVEWQGAKYQMRLQAVAYAYSDYDRIQSAEVVKGWEVYSGLAVLTPVDSSKSAEKAVVLPVVGTQKDAQVELRPLDLLTTLKDRPIAAEDMRLWMQSKTAASEQDRVIRFTLNEASAKAEAGEVKRYAGYARYVMPSHAGQSYDFLTSLYVSDSLSSDFVFGVMAAAPSYKSREEFQKESSLSISQQKLWTLRRTLEAKDLSDLEDDVRRMEPEAWKAISNEVFGKNVSIEEVLAVAKDMTSVPQLDHQLNPLPQRTAGEWHEAMGCDALQVFVYPIVGRRFGNEIHWVTGEWVEASELIPQFLTLKSSFNGDILSGETRREVLYLKSPALVSEGHLKLR